jgi:tetratricopeptide (TPR) repeat protein
MNKDNVLFCAAGLLLGLIVGFFAANAINQNVATVGSAAVQQPASGSLPPGHPAIPGNSAAGAGPGGSAAEVQSAIDKAKQDPKDFDAQMKAAELFYQIQRYDGAIEYLTKANQLRPDDVEVITNLGNVNFDAEHYPEAEKWYVASLAKKPDNLDVRTDLGLTFIFRSDPNYDRAIEEFKRVLATDPSHVQALQNLTVAYTKKGDAANAKSTLSRLEQADPSNKALAQLRTDIGNIGTK